ncbi:MAG: DUF4253 domain-containing protein [Pseudomonadota bacterium]
MTTLPFDTITLPGSQVRDALPGLRRDGVWPVVMGDPAQAELIAEIRTPPEHPLYAHEERLAGFDLDAWLENRADEAQALAEEYEFDWLPRGPVRAEAVAWAHRAPTLDTDFRGHPLPQVLIGLPRIEAGWQFPSLTQYGGWNAHPFPLVHMALFHRWEAEFGARLVSFGQDIIEMRVARPPRTYEAAEALAIAQYLYCPDLVDQGHGTIDTLTAVLLAGHDWHFWWD